MRNPFALSPVSFSALASYLECPGCALEQKRRRSPKEPKEFSRVRQGAFFGGGEPDPRLVGTLLHLIVNFLHDTQHSPLTKTQQEALLADSRLFINFLRHDLLAALRMAGKLKLAMFFDELSMNEERLRTTVLSPMLLYQRELARSGDTVLAASERFHFKLLSTRNTFSGHPDWGGYVGFVGEFDQIRLRKVGDVRRPGGVPAIMEFKKGLGKARKGGTSPPGLFDGLEEENPTDSSSASAALPTPAHAMQLMVYWLAFQTRWDVLGKVNEKKGLISDIRMPLQQELDLILYNLNDGCQYQLLTTNPHDAFTALTNCIFFLNWAMKSGYAQQESEHECRKTKLVDMPPCWVPVGANMLPSEECYRLAKEAFEQFKATIKWEKLSR